MSNPRTTTTKIRDLTPNITIFSTRFNRFAPFGYRKFVAVGNRATAIRLKDGRILLLNPVPLEQCVRDRLNSVGGVHLLAADLGHHLYIKEYLDAWPEANTIGVTGLERKRKDVRWDSLYHAQPRKPEDELSFSDEMETVYCPGFITRAVAWYHKPSQTLIISDLLMKLPAKEQYSWHSDVGPLSRAFAWGAKPSGLWFRSLIWWLATTDYEVMRRDAKKIAEWDVQRLMPCHGDLVEGDGGQAWAEGYEWFLKGPAKAGVLRRVGDRVRRVARELFLI